MVGLPRRGPRPSIDSLLWSSRERASTHRACFIDQDELLGLGLEHATELIDVTLTRANAPKLADLSPLILSDKRNCNGPFMDIKTGVKRARLAHG
jgi:hypothetical protein